MPLAPQLGQLRGVVFTVPQGSPVGVNSTFPWWQPAHECLFLCPLLNWCFQDLLSNAKRTCIQILLSELASGRLSLRQPTLAFPCV